MLLSGCASTGRGGFPEFPDGTRTDKHLAVLPVAGKDSRRIESSVFYHLNRRKLKETFARVSIVKTNSVRNLLTSDFSLEGLSNQQADRLASVVDADWVLGFVVHDFRVERFTTTETKRLDQTEVRHRRTDIDREGKQGDGSIRTTDSQYSSQEIPVEEGKVRAVLSMSAAVYDLNNRKLLWSGRRIERAQDQVEDLSSIELVDIVVERVMYQVISRLAG